MSRLPVQRGDALQVSSWNALTSVSLTIRGLFHSEGRPPIALEFAHTPNSDRTINSSVHPLGDGELSHVTVFVAGAAPIIGQTFVRLQLVRGLASSGIVLATLAADYLTAVQPLAWPGSPIRRSVEGPGAIRSIVGTDPAPGVNSSETVPTGARWTLRCLRYTFTTDVTVANREFVVVVDDGVNEFCRINTGLAQPASQPWIHALYPHGAKNGVSQANIVDLGLPDLTLLAASRVRTLITSLQAGDDLSLIQLLVEEHLEGAA